MSLFRRGDVWWYEFWFAGRRIRESSKSPSKTVAKGAEQKRKRELEAGFNNFTDLRHERIRTFSDMADEYFDAYKLRLPQSARFAEYAIDHLKQLLGGKMLVDFNEATIIHYQNARLGESAAPKSVNEEVGFLLRILGDPGDLLRIRLRKRKMLKLKVRQTVGKAYTPAEKDRMLDEARKARSPHIYLALTLALNAGMRDAEIRTLTWGQLDFTKNYLAVGQSKTEAGEGRTIPLNSTLLEVFSEYVSWYQEKFGKPRTEWYVFPFGKPSPSDPTRPVTTLKTAWNNVRTNARLRAAGTTTGTPNHRPCGKRRWRSDHHGYRWARFQADAQALQPHSHGSEAPCSGVHSQGTVDHGDCGIRPEDRTGRGYPQESPHGLQTWVSRQASSVLRQKLKTHTRSIMEIWIAQNRPQMRRVLMGGTHKSPHSWLILRMLRE